MKHSFLFMLALILCGAIALRSVSAGVTAYEDGGRERIDELTGSNAVEVDSIRFETIVSKRVLTIPTNQPGANVPVQFGIRITNKTQKPVRFGLYYSLSLNIVGQNGTPEFGNIRTEGLKRPNQKAFPLVMPGKSITSFMEGQIFWRNNKLIMSVESDFGAINEFGGLKPGSYHISCIYDNKQADGSFLLFQSVEKLSDGTVAIRNLSSNLFEGKVWIGKIFTQPEVFRLVTP